jgi:hypothetical protein
MPYAANDDDAAGGVEAGIESDYSDSTEKGGQGELQFLNMCRERTARLPSRLRPLGVKWRMRNARCESLVRSACELEN